MFRLIAAAVALAASCGTAIAGISFEEEIPVFRQALDAWRIKGDLRGEWTDYGLVVNASERSGFTMEYSRYPGMKPFRGADEIVLEMKSNAQGKVTAELVYVYMNSRMKFMSPVTVSFSASMQTTFLLSGISFSPLKSLR